MSAPEGRRPSAADVYAVLCAYAGRPVARCRLTLADGSVLIVPCPCGGEGAPADAPRPAGAPAESALEAAILQALAERPPGSYVVGREVAALAGYPFGGRFSEALGRLGRRGKIHNVRGRGYAIGPHPGPAGV